MEQSLDEVNAQRIAVGLKPLATPKEEAKAKTVVEDEEEEDDAFDMFATREQEKADEEAEKIRDKLSSAKMKRKMQQSLDAEVGLGDTGTKESTKDWLASFAKRTETAAQTHQKLEQQKVKRQKIEEKQVAVPSGLLVGHKADDFDEGATVILTLKDEQILERKGVLLKEKTKKAGDDDDEDVLVNVDLVEKEKVQKNLKLKEKLKTRGLQSRGITEDPSSKKKKLLSKYDDEDDAFFG
jgi:U4/U6.U5 tri-snRNP-associated protein 1